MSHVETLREAWEAFNAGDPAPFLDLYDPDIVLRAEAGPTLLESGSFFGAADVRHWFEQVFAAWGKSYRFTVEEMIEVGDSVVVIGRSQATGREAALAAVGR